MLSFTLHAGCLIQKLHESLCPSTNQIAAPFLSIGRNWGELLALDEGINEVGDFKTLISQLVCLICSDTGGKDGLVSIRERRVTMCPRGVNGDKADAFSLQKPLGR